MERLALDPDGIAALVHETLDQRIGGWSMGVQGAIAEFTVVDDIAPVMTVHRSGRTVEAVTTDGGLRLTVSDETTAFAAGGTVYLALPRRTLPPPAAGVSLADADPAALRTEDRGSLVADLAIGHAAARFCVRTADPDLANRLRSIEGASWTEALTAIGPALVSASPHRIVTTPLGRIEVYAPIPEADSVAPDGPHTHLLPALLRTGRELPPRLELPAGFAPAAAFHPLPEWDPPGR